MPKSRAHGLIVLLSSLVAMGLGCVERPAEPSIGIARRPSTAVGWTNVSSNVTDSGNDLVKVSGGLSWNAGASSVEKIDRRGYVEFTTAETNTDKAAGLNHNDADKTMADIDFAFFLHADGTWTLRQNDAPIAGVNGSYAANDVFKVEVKQGVVKYYQNGSWVYTSTVTPQFPLVADTALRTVGATINDVVLTTTKMHIATQQEKLPDNRLSCGDADVILINGTTLLQVGGNITLADFLDGEVTTYQDVYASLDSYKQAKELDDFTGILVLDIENPHPSDLGDDSLYTDEQKNLIVDAYIRRIQAAEDVFPTAQLGLYATLYPNPNGIEAQGYLDRRDALKEAAFGAPPYDSRWGYPAGPPESETPEGLYDRLEYLIPLLYDRYGCDVISGPCDNGWDRLDEYTELGVSGSASLPLPLSPLPMLPLLSTSVINCLTCSEFATTMLMDLTLSNPADPAASLDASIGVQLDLLAEDDVTDAAIWIGNGSNYSDDGVLQAGSAENPYSRTIDDYACGI
jgi:hypothetical protein